MQVATWKTWMRAGILAVGLAILPMTMPAEAQQRDPIPSETRRTDTRNETGFPWGLLGLTGLFGLAGLKRNHTLTERRRVDEPVRRTA
jgi:hypothetical protein